MTTPNSRWIHPEAHPLARTTAKVQMRMPGGTQEPRTVRIEDWADRVYPGSWMWMASNPVALDYAMRAGLAALPLDNEVLYASTDGPNGHALLIHVSELATEEGTPK